MYHATIAVRTRSFASPVETSWKKCGFQGNCERRRPPDLRLTRFPRFLHFPKKKKYSEHILEIPYENKRLGTISREINIPWHKEESFVWANKRTVESVTNYHTIDKRNLFAYKNWTIQFPIQYICMQKLIRKKEKDVFHLRSVFQKI